MIHIIKAMKGACEGEGQENSLEQSQSSGSKLISFSKELCSGGNQFNSAGSRAN